VTAWATRAIREIVLLAHSPEWETADAGGIHGETGDDAARVPGELHDLDEWPVEVVGQE
jgi:hypothetical protein